MVLQEKFSKICTLKQIQILCCAMDDMEPDKFEELMNSFSFDDLISINIMNRELLRYHAIFLLKLTDKETFFVKDKSVVQTLEFVLANLMSLEKTGHSEELLGLLLKLLRCIISQSKQRKILSEVFQKERERILEVLSKTTKLKAFAVDNVEDCFTVISDMLEIHGVLPLTTSRNLAEIAEIFKGLQIVRELSLLTSIVFKRFTISSEVFSICACWLLLYGPMLLNENSDDQILCHIMRNMTDFYTKYSYIRNTKRHQKSDILNAFEHFFSTLSANSNLILSLFNNPKLKEDATKILAILLAEYSGEKWDVHCKKLKGMPDDIAEWPKCRNEAFFEMCAFLCRYSSPVWTPADILHSTSTLLYSYDRYTLSTSHLKAVCFVYPVLLPFALTKRTVLLGDDLLIVVWKRHHELEDVLTPHPAQLCWILRRGEEALKKRVLCYWLREKSIVEEEEEDLRRCVRWCAAGEVVKGLLMDRRLEEGIVARAIELIQSLNDTALSTRISMMLFFVFRDKMLFRRLILARPGIPEDRATAMKLCEFMSIQLVYIQDEKVFSIACAFCKNLVVSLKTEADVVTAFCRDLRTVKFLLIRLPQLGDEAAMEVLGLLKILVLVQKRNNTRFNCKLEIDLHYSLHGRHDKTDKCLDLLQLVVSKDLFLQLSPSTIDDLFRKLLDVYTRRPDLTVKSLLCMTEILKANQWLASANTTMSFVEVNCSLEIDERSWQELVVFLGMWLKILNKHKSSARYMVHFGIVRNYIRRVPYLPQKQGNNLWKMLDKLEG